MKKTVFSLALLAGTLAAPAQTYVFAGADGQPIANGSTVTRTEQHVSPMAPRGYDIESGLFVKNVDASTAYEVDVETTITQMDNGTLECCFPTTCIVYSATGTYTSVKGQVAQGAQASLHSEWVPAAADGTCTVTYTIRVFNGPIELTDKRYSVTVSYLDGAAGIEPAAVGSAARVVGRYDLQGRQRAVSSRGLVFERMSDGSVRKRIQAVFQLSKLE